MHVIIETLKLIFFKLYEIMFVNMRYIHIKFDYL